MELSKFRVEHSRRPAGRECAFILSLNLTASLPQPKTKRKTRKAEQSEETKRDEKKPQAKVKPVKNKPILATKPEDIPLPSSPKKKARPALRGVDVNKPILAIQPTIYEAAKEADRGIGQIFGNYQTIKKLGAGSFGEVYLGVDLVSNRQVALKLEPKTASIPMLEVEAKMYETLRGAAGIPVMKVCGNFPRKLCLLRIHFCSGLAPSGIIMFWYFLFWDAAFQAFWMLVVDASACPQFS